MLTTENTLRALQLTIAEQAGKQQPVSIAISDSHGELLAFVRMDGASLHSGVVAQNKAYTAARDRQATADLGAWSRSSGRSMGYWSDTRFTGFGGGLPLRVNGEVVGAVGVSALSEDEDVLVAQALITRLLP